MSNSSPQKGKRDVPSGDKAQSSFDAVSLLNKLRGGASVEGIGIPHSIEHTSNARIQMENQQLKQRIRDLESNRRILESHIESLVQENEDLRTINTNYHEENENLEKMVAEARAKSDHTIAELRNKIAVLSRGKGKRMSAKRENNSTGHENGPDDNLDFRHHRNSIGSFAGPTFSELMRRATPAPEVFNNTLRRQSVPGSLPTGTHRPGIVPTKPSSSPEPMTVQRDTSESPVHSSHDAFASKSADAHDDIFLSLDSPTVMGSLEVIDVTVDHMGSDSADYVHHSSGGKHHRVHRVASASLPVIDIDLGN